MKNLFIAMGCILTCIGQSLTAQYNSFDLSSYLYPEVKMRQLNTRFDLSGEYSYDQFTKGIYNNTRGSEFENSMDINFNSYHYTRIQSNNSYVNLNMRTAFEDYKINKQLKNETFLIYPHLTAFESKTKYKSEENNDFYSAGFKLDMSIYKLKNYYSNSNYYYSNENIKGHAKYIQGFIPLSVGTGRIESVTNARHAIYILDELTKQNRLNGKGTNEEIVNLADLITTIKNERILDSRIRKIYEIETVDSFLVENHEISKHDARYFTTLNDYWLYGNSPARASGIRAKVDIVPGLFYYDEHYKYHDSDNNTKNSIISASVTGGVRVDYEKPINLYWQNTLNFETSIGYNRTWYEDKVNKNYFDLLIPYYYVLLSNTIGFYPNTRTDIRISHSLRYINMLDESDKTDDIIGIEGKGVMAISHIDINYYFSPKFRLQFSTYINFRWKESEDYFNFDFYNIGNSYNLITNYDIEYNTYEPNNNYIQYTSHELDASFNISMLYSIF